MNEDKLYKKKKEELSKKNIGSSPSDKSKLFSLCDTLLRS